jgi:hypothetical protein
VTDVALVIAVGETRGKLYLMDGEAGIRTVEPINSVSHF